MFTKEFDHSKRNIKEACGFTNENYVESIVNAFLKIFNDSYQYSRFVETAENQIIGNDTIPNSVRISIRILLIMCVPQLKTLSHIKEVTIVSLGSLESLRKELRNAIKEAAAHEDFDPDEEIEKLASSLKDTGKGKKETEEEMKAFKEFLKNELKEIKEDDHDA